MLARGRLVASSFAPSNVAQASLNQAYSSSPHPCRVLMSKFENSSVHHRVEPVVRVPYPSATTSGDSGRPIGYADDATEQEAVPNRTHSKGLFSFAKQVLHVALGVVQSCTKGLSRGRGRREATARRALREERARRLPSSSITRSTISHSVQSVVVVPLQPE